MADFDMPGHGAGFPARGGWVVRHLMSDLGLTANQAAGIVGNIGYESGGFEELQEISPLVSGSAGGYGWAQWTGTRRTSYMAWCAHQGLAPSSDQANYGYLLVEFRGAYAYVLAALKRQSDIGSCVFTIGRLYEAPYGTTASHLPAYSERLSYAQKALAGATQAPLPITTPSIVTDKPRPIVPNATVRQVQQRLVALGYDLDDDGVAGPATCGAVLAALS